MNLFLFAGGSEGGENPYAFITPDPGLFIWTLVVFVILWALLAKFAFKPITKALKNREDSISDALQSAERARAEVAELKNLLSYLLTLSVKLKRKKQRLWLRLNQKLEILLLKLLKN